MDYNLGLFNSLLSDKANFSHKSVFASKRQKEMFSVLFRSAQKGSGMSILPP